MRARRRNAPPAAGWTQLELSVPGQSRRFHARHRVASAITSPALEQARSIAARLGEARGWNPRIQAETSRALAVMLAAHVPGEKIPWSALVPALRPRDLSVSRTAEILARAGLLGDDHVPALDTWAESRLAGPAPGIAACARSWLHALQHGTPRARPRKPDTIRVCLRCVHPLLADWPARYGHLRQAAAAGAAAAIGALRGHKRHQVLAALRSLMRHCKKAGLIFAGPAARIRAARRPGGVILPLGPAQISAATAAAVTPDARLALALAAVHAARPEAIRQLALGDAGLGNRRIAIAGQSRPPDDLTRRLILTRLDCRRARRPHTASPYLITNQQTAMSTRPATGELAFHYCYLPEGQARSLPRLIRAAGLRWPVEESFEFSKGCFGLDQSQVRLYTAIARHTALVMAALAICAVTAALLRRRTDTRAAAPVRPDQPPPADAGMIPLTVPEIGRLLAHPPPPGAAGYWLDWRRGHQARAAWYHQRTRLARDTEITLVR